MDHHAAEHYKVQSTAPAERRHMRDFLAAIDRQGKPVADIGEGHISTATCQLANLALQLGRPLAYDPEARSIPGDIEATNLLRRPYSRSGSGVIRGRARLRP